MNQAPPDSPIAETIPPESSPEIASEIVPEARAEVAAEVAAAVAEGGAGAAAGIGPEVRPLALRGRAFKALALVPDGATPDLLGAWFARLDAALARSPTLFDGRALVLDVAALAPEGEAGTGAGALRTLLDELLRRRVRVLGLEGASPDLLARWAAAGGPADPPLPPLLAGGRPLAVLDPLSESDAVPSEAAGPAVTSLTVEGSVRSGQCVVHPTGDVTVTGSVASGAEVLAGGNIHVYGALRGRAIAGAARNPRARIYCRKFEPELLGIDRLVRTAEDMGPGLRGKPAQVWLDGGAIRLAGLD